MMHCHVDPTHSHAVYRTFGDVVLLLVCLRCTEIGIDTGVFTKEQLISMPRREGYEQPAEG